MTRNRLLVVPACVFMLGAATLGLAGSASAHVTVAAPGVAVGASDAQINFRVPTESDTASTTEVKVQLPTDHPIAGVLVEPIAGWTAKITNTKLSTPIHTDDGDITEVVSEIDWTATPASAIKPGFFGVFTIIAGKLPDDTSTLTFKAIQTYSDGSTVSWIEEPAPGSTAEPDHPAPMLSLAAAGAQGSSESASSTTAPGSTTPAQVSSSSKSASKASATTGIALGAIGVVLGAVALGLAAQGRRRAH